jgi:hypothetical protein
MLGLGADGDGTPLVLLRRADTVDLDRAAAAIGGGELDLDHLIDAVVDGGSPTNTVLSLGADGLLLLPINEELAGIDALLRVRLPLDVAASRTDYVNSVLLLTAEQNGGRDIARTLASVDGV